MSFSDNYEYAEHTRDGWLVVEDLSDADYAYADDLDGYEVRLHGSRLGQYDSWSEVEDALENK